MQISLPKFFILCAVALAVLLIAASYYVESRKSLLLNEIATDITEQATRLKATTELSAKDQLDDSGAQIIKDCAVQNRERFDFLISRLQSLTPPELYELNSLYDGCAGFYADSRAFMVDRLAYEYTTYLTLIDLAAKISGEEVHETYRTVTWSDLIELEKKISSLQAERISLQRRIITALIAGESTGADSVQTIVADAHNVTEEIVVLSQQAGRLRTDLLAS